MEKVEVPEIVLNSGYKMPLVGMGSATRPLPPPDQLKSIFLDAIEVGYRHFDTAMIYGTEEILGKAVAEAIGRGLIRSRDEVFITSKVWCTDVDHDLVLPALKETLRNLRLEYVDLYLVHWPVKIKHGADPFSFSKEEILPFDISETWEAMEESCRLGLAKSIGVSNFSDVKLSNLLKNATIPPAVNQVEMNVGWQQQKLINFCQEKGIRICAWSPLGAYGLQWGSNAVIENPILKTIADAKGKTVPQVALRWLYEQGVCFIVKSFNKERMKQNLEIFNWELTNEEIKYIEQIPQIRVVTGELFLNPNGPYKSLEELWDGDI